VTIGSYKDVKVEKIDDLTVRVKVTSQADAVLGRRLRRYPRHADPKASVRRLQGRKSRDAPNNLKPVGTGPYKFVDFKPGDMVRGELNPNYHMPNRPYFDTIEMKGGGDAVSAARAVLQTGEYDYAWNLQVEDEILRLEKGGKGTREHRRRRRHRIHQLNSPIPGPRSTANARTSRPSIRCFPIRRCARRWPAGRSRIGMQEFIYGRTGVATPTSSTTREIPFEET
jgi:peptide/nickel transport system substrate-binding protein